MKTELEKCLAGEWFDRYDDGADCTLWYTKAAAHV